MNGDLIRLERAEIGYESPLLPPIDLAIHRAQKLAVLGPNGGGKSTLLKTIIGLVPPLTGRRLFPNGGAPRIGYVPQSHRADPVYPLTAADVVLQGRFARIGRFHFPGKADREVALKQLQKVGLLQCAGLPFRELSGGQRQRVLLARALCGEPDLLVLDEFTSDLDPAASAGLLAEVSRLADELSVSVLFVTHEIGAAVSHASEVAMVDSRSGVFESGAASAMLTSERLSRLYGQHVDVQRQEGKAVVFIETPTGAAS